MCRDFQRCAFVKSAQHTRSHIVYRFTWVNIVSKDKEWMNQWWNIHILTYPNIRPFQLFILQNRDIYFCNQDLWTEVHSQQSAVSFLACPNTKMHVRIGLSSKYIHQCKEFVSKHQLKNISKLNGLRLHFRFQILLFEHYEHIRITAREKAFLQFL